MSIKIRPLVFKIIEPEDTVTIGTQVWKNANLAVDDGGAGIVRVDNVTANGVNFGTQYYYTYDAAVRVAASISGYHLPTVNDWYNEVIMIGWEPAGAKKLNSTSGWSDNANGTDEYGFNSLPVGCANERGTTADKRIIRVLLDSR